MLLLLGMMGPLGAAPPHECIYFVREGDLWVVEPDGSNPRPVVKTEMREEFPVCSPDGQWIAFQLYDASRKQYDLWVMRSDGRGARTLVRNARHPAWSPTGEWLAFDVPQGNSVDIGLVRADGSEFRLWTESPALEMFPTWSPWGDALAFVRTHATLDAQGKVVHLVSQIVVRVGEEQRTLFTQAGVSIVGLSWSVRDELAFGMRPLGADRTQHLWRLRWDGTGLQRLSPEGTGVESAPSWSPDGHWLVFSRLTPEGGELWRMRADGSERAPLLTEGRNDQMPFWFPGVENGPIQIWQGERRSYWIPLPVVRNGEVWVPLREMARAWKWEVERGSRGEVRVLDRRYPLLVFRGDQAMARSEGRSIPLSGAPYLLHGYWMVPFLSLAKGMEWEVSWDPEQRVLRVPEKFE